MTNTAPIAFRIIALLNGSQGETARRPGGIMRFYPLAAIATAVTAAALVFVPGALASSPGAVQVTGTRLASALVPAAAFNSGTPTTAPITSGSHLEHGSTGNRIAALSCYLFSDSSYFEGISGETAWATDVVVPGSTNPNDIIANYAQSVHQFASARAARVYYGEVESKFSRCRSFTEPDPFDPVHETLQYLTTTYIDGHQAFRVAQLGTFTAPDSLGHLVDYFLIAVDGADVFIAEFHAQTISHTDTPPNHPALDVIVGQLIARVSALR